MAISYFSSTAFKGTHGGADQRLAYITGGETDRLTADARVLHQGQEVNTERPRSDVVEWKARNLPQWAKENPVTFFRAAQREEGGRTAYTEWRVALPREMTLEQQLDTAHTFLDVAFGTQHPLVYAVHNPDALDGSGSQPHMHILWSGRAQDGIERSQAQFFRQVRNAHPEQGGTPKAPWTYHKGSLAASRQLYTDVMNTALARHGYAARLHPGRLEERGFTREKAIKILPLESHNLRHGRPVSDATLTMVAQGAERRPHAQMEAADAQAYWVCREQQLGIGKEMTPDEQHVRIKEARQRRITEPPVRATKESVALEFAALTAEAQAVVKLAAALKIERAIEERYAARGKTRPARGIQRMERLLAAVGYPEAARHVIAAHERTPDHTRTRAAHVQALRRGLKRRGKGEEDGTGAALRVRLYEEEERRQQQDRAHGMSF